MKFAVQSYKLDCVAMALILYSWWIYADFEMRENLQVGTFKPGQQFCEVVVRGTLRASLSGTFLQTLSDLVTPPKGHSLSPAAVQRRVQRPPKGSGTNMTVEAT